MKHKTYLLLYALMPIFIFGMEAETPFTCIIPKDLWKTIFAFLDNNTRDNVRTTCQELKDLYGINNIELYTLQLTNLTQKRTNYAFMLMLYNNKLKQAEMLHAKGAFFDANLLHVDPIILATYKKRVKKHLAHPLYGNSPSILSICITAYFGDNESLRPLLESLYLPEKTSLRPNPFLCAIRNSHRETVLLLLRHKQLKHLISNNVFEEALCHASILSELLLRFDPNKFTIPICKKCNLPLLHYAARSNYYDAVSILCNHSDIDINSIDKDTCQPKTPLGHAAQHGNINIIELLLSYPKCDVDGSAKTTPLYCACAKGYSKIVKLLLDRGADCSRLIGSQSYLHITAIATTEDNKNEYHEIMKMLLEKKPSLNNIRDKDDISPLHITVQWDDIDGTQILLNSEDIDVNCVNYEKKTPLDIAYKTNDTKMITLLKQHGAKPATYDINFGWNPLSWIS